MNPVTRETKATDCLMIIDDQEANIQVLGMTLGRLGFEIMPATSGEQALKALAVRQPDLILLDLLMPDMDGFELCRRIKENPAWAEIPIIFLSASDDKNLIVRALESGGMDYVTKPFNKPELISRVRTHLMLKTSRDHLKRLAQDREELLGMISHYLQNHLAGMTMSAELLHNRAKDATDPKLRLMSENIWNSSTQMQAFVKALLANAIADLGLTIKLQAVSLTDSAARAVKQYGDRARKKNILLRTEFPSQQLMVRADSAALDQVLDNLLSNAIKFSPPDREVFVVLRAGPAQAECDIRDQGAGFTPEDKTKMFQRYTRLSAQPTDGEPSTGLGLSIVKKLVQAMSGDLVCQSEPGQGATFTVRLPTIPAKTTE